MSQAQDSSNAGAIAGGVIGKVLFIAITTYLICRIVLAARRHKLLEELETDKYDSDEDITKVYGFTGGDHNLADREEHVRSIAQARPESEIPNSSM
jgi:hypothetical protein